MPTPDSPPVRARGTLYLVRSGDTLSAIAVRFNVTVQSIVVANNLPNADVLRIGQQLLIPSPALVLSIAETTALQDLANQKAGVLGIGDPTTPIVSETEIRQFLAGKRTTYYVARKGDTVQRIAGLFKIDPLILAQINRVGQEGELIPGTRLIIPM
jgi:LysM repeat protein